MNNLPLVLIGTLSGDLNFTRFPTLDLAISGLLNIGTLAAALVAVAVLVYGGVMYITSTGDSQKTEKAQNTIIYALVGLVIVGLAWLLVGFILKALGITGTSLQEAVEETVAIFIR
ncbi:hypothetical protein JW962_02490 [Candidatus Dojkabacteria bacterium]|nr:hypothetical protein [Candidatus Dojkabacteria bacterium]